MQPDKHHFPARKQNPESNGVSLFILVSSSSLMLQSTTPLASPKDSHSRTPGVSSTGVVEHISRVWPLAFCLLELGVVPPHLPIRREAARDGVSQERRKNVGEMAGEARFSREMATARGLNGDPAQARRDSPDPGRRHDGRGHLAAILRRRAGRAPPPPRG